MKNLLSLEIIRKLVGGNPRGKESNLKFCCMGNKKILKQVELLYGYEREILLVLVEILEGDPVTTQDGDLRIELRETSK